MDNIMNMVMAAFQGNHAIEAIIIAVLLALIMGSLMQDIFFAAIAVIIQLFLPVAYDVVQSGNASGVGAKAGEILQSIPAQWQTVAVMYVVYLIVIGILFFIKSMLFRR
jgi:hypothetical protein